MNEEVEYKNPRTATIIFFFSDKTIHIVWNDDDYSVKYLI